MVSRRDRLKVWGPRSSAALAASACYGALLSRTAETQAHAASVKLQPLMANSTALSA